MFQRTSTLVALAFAVATLTGSAPARSAPARSAPARSTDVLFRALVVLRASTPDPKAPRGSTDRFVVSDVRIGKSDVTVYEGDGLVAVADGKPYALQLRHFSSERRGKHGTATARWTELHAKALPDGNWERLDGGPPDVPLPDEGAPVGNELQAGPALIGVLGPYVFLDETYYGYFGGAHDVDETDVHTLRLPDGARVPAVDVMGEAFRGDVYARIAEINRERQREGLEPLPAKPAEVDSSWALRFLPSLPARTAIGFQSLISCCTWAENHNHYEFELPVGKLPPALEKLTHVVGDLRLSFQPPGGKAPGGKATLTATHRAIEVTPPKGPRVEHPHRLLKAPTFVGIHWVSPDLALDVTKLPPPVTAPPVTAPPVMVR